MTFVKPVALKIARHNDFVFIFFERSSTMQCVNYFGGKDGIKTFCPFCGKLAYDENQETEVSLTCEHVLFQTSDACVFFDAIREDIATGEGEDPFIRETLLDPLGPDEDPDDGYTMSSQIERANLPNAVCFVLSHGGCGYDGYVAFSAEDYTIRKLSAK